MAAVTLTEKRSKVGRDGRCTILYYGTGSSNTDATLTTTAVTLNKKQRLLYSLVAYSGSPTQAGVTTGLDSGISSAYDNTFNTGSANLRYTAYSPTVAPPALPGDAFVVTALAGGSVTAAIIIAVEEE